MYNPYAYSKKRLCDACGKTWREHNEIRCPDGSNGYFRVKQKDRTPLKRVPLKRSVTPIAKKAKRKDSWVVVDGVRTFLKSGREVCITEAAWQKRRLECCRFYGYQCQCGCKTKTFAIVTAFDCHHLHGRGRGRDDRLMVKGKPNLVPLLRDHHMKEHNQEWSKGELQWQGLTSKK